MPAEGRGLSSRRTQEVARDQEIGQPINSEECSETADGVTRESEGRSRYRFYALYDKIYREDILAHAYAQCRSNQGAPGVDGQDFADVEAYGVQRWLGELALALKDETYRPDPIRRVFIPKANGKLRPLGISTLRDRVCMTAAMLVLEPIFEADLPPEQYAYRPGRNAQQAVIEVEELLFTRPSGRRGCRPRGLLRKHSARRTDAVARAAHRRSACAASDQDVAGMRRRRRLTNEGGRHERPRPRTAGAAFRRVHPSHHCWRICICAGLFWDGRSSGWSEALAARIVTYADDLVILCRRARPKKPCSACARSWAS